MLTLQKLKDMKPGIFARGEIIDGPEGVNICDTGRLLRWAATRGDIYDWAIYVHFANNDWKYIKTHGDKIYSEQNIRKLVPCDNEAFKMYRH